MKKMKMNLVSVVSLIGVVFVGGSAIMGCAAKNNTDTELIENETVIEEQENIVNVELVDDNTEVLTEPSFAPAGDDFVPVENEEVGVGENGDLEETLEPTVEVEEPVEEIIIETEPVVPSMPVEEPVLSNVEMCGNYHINILDTTMYATTNVNVRTQPNTNGSVLIRVNEADSVHVIGRCQETGWYKVRYQGEEGFSCDDYYTSVEPPVALYLTAYVSGTQYVGTSIPAKDIVVEAVMSDGSTKRISDFFAGDTYITSDGMPLVVSYKGMSVTINVSAVSNPDASIPLSSVLNERNSKRNFVGRMYINDIGMEPVGLYLAATGETQGVADRADSAYIRSMDCYYDRSTHVIEIGDHNNQNFKRNVNIQPGMLAYINRGDRVMKLQCISSENGVSIYNYQKAYYTHDRCVSTITCYPGGTRTLTFWKVTDDSEIKFDELWNELSAYWCNAYEV